MSQIFRFYCVKGSVGILKKANYLSILLLTAPTRLLANPEIDFVISDINMPVMNGLEFLTDYVANSRWSEPLCFQHTVIWKIFVLQ